MKCSNSMEMAKRRCNGIGIQMYKVYNVVQNLINILCLKVAQHTIHYKMQETFLNSFSVYMVSKTLKCKDFVYLLRYQCLTDVGCLTIQE